MPTIPYDARKYSPPPICPDDSGPIAVPRTFPDDPAFVCVKDASSNRYIYERLTKITVTTAFPLEITHPQYEPIRRIVIQIKTQDKNLADLEVIVSCFPYSFDREAISRLKGHNNRSHDESLDIRKRLCQGEIPVEQYLRTKTYRDLNEPNSKILTAYFPELHPSAVDVWSGQRRKTTKLSELLAFGFCENVEFAVNDIYENDLKIMDLKAEVNPSILQRFWKNHPCCRQLDLLSESLIDPANVEKVLKSAIRKALSGPITNQKRLVGEPVATWARCIFLGAMYNLSRRKKFQVNTPQAENFKEDVAPQDFMDLVASSIFLSEDWEGDWDDLALNGIKKLPHNDPHERRVGLALLCAICERIEFGDSVQKTIRELSQHDPDALVREAAIYVLSQLKAELGN